MRRVVIKLSASMAILIIAIFCGTISQAAFLTNVPITLVQPDGDTVACLVTGDEFYHRVHDANDYTIVKDYKTGYFFYAQASGESLVASNLIAGRDNPADHAIQPGLAISEEQYLARRQFLAIPDKNAVNAPTSGTVNALCVFIRFSDETEFTRLRSFYDDIFNDQTMAQNTQINYYEEVSYGRLQLTTSLYPEYAGAFNLSYQDAHPRAYYQYDSLGTVGYATGEERTIREHTLLKNAVAAIESEVPGGLNIDADGDEFVDAINFIIRGDPDGWGALLWAHRWVLISPVVYINGSQVYDYTFHLDNTLDNGVICHEMFHVLGAPDLYHYKSAFKYLKPTGPWGLMGQQADFPAHMGGYMKHRYGKWIDSIPWITRPGSYQLNPLTDSLGNLFRVPSPFSGSEYFVLEFRNKATSIFELSLPEFDGLLVYRINSLIDGLGNRNGPPDEVYIYRAFGDTLSDGFVKLAALSESGRANFNDTTDNRCFMSDGSLCGIAIENIGPVADVMTFDVVSDRILFGSVYDGNGGPLTVEGGPYLVGEEVIVPTGQTLTIEPGTSIVFYAQGVITANGILTADGSTMPIEFQEYGVDLTVRMNLNRKLNIQNGASLRIPQGN